MCESDGAGRIGLTYPHIECGSTCDVPTRAMPATATGSTENDGDEDDEEDEEEAEAPPRVWPAARLTVVASSVGLAYTRQRSSRVRNPLDSIPFRRPSYVNLSPSRDPACSHASTHSDPLEDPLSATRGSPCFLSSQLKSPISTPAAQL